MQPRTSQTPVWQAARLKRSRGTPLGLADPGKVKALRREGPKRGAKELFRIIETPESPVNIETIRKYHADTIDNVEARCKTRRKNSSRRPAARRRDRAARRAPGIDSPGAL